MNFLSKISKRTPEAVLKELQSRTPGGNPEGITEWTPAEISGGTYGGNSKEIQRGIQKSEKEEN